ncbi:MULTISPECIES: MaoC family dehydratase [Nocardiaceae]|uniref:MaoC family dehydratase n=1 Tax=Nocardiaceae TaxID=85025 RepID=UPI00052308B6|nr:MULTISPECIES: MaoC family dehydratase [Rhodococcus]
MSLDLSAVGRTTPPVLCQWDSNDALLYALAIGAGQEDPSRDLTFTTENSDGIQQRVFPTYASVLTDFVAAATPDIGPIEMAHVVHAEQSVEVRRTLPTSGSMRVTTEVKHIFDKGSGALVVVEASGWLPDDEASPSITSRSSIFIKGEGGFGIRSPKSAWSVPDRAPDALLHSQSRPDQALLYRLTGDRNPLHSDPSFAARAGFDRPILHGMCTFGIVGRVLLDFACDGEPEKFLAMNARFSSPVYPGDLLTVCVWREANEIIFRALSPSGIVLDRGSLTTQ